ncbi:MAG: AarF/ABC1/UbiB kinase family protein, partial [Planctomycetes bacterium]|nr:AarF/ABC1/UbiB kinase family protein [Planctomycetota bacterium]
MAKGQKPPASRLGRTVQLARLATGTGARLALGLARRATQSSEQSGASEGELADHRQAALHAVKILGNMKGLAMKAGQIVSYVDDWMPDDVRPAYQEILTSLQSNAPVVPLAEMLNVFIDEVGEPPDEVFRSFDDEPIASASIGQVYRAELPDGTPVAVKIQYPGIAEVIASDLKNLGLLEAVIRRSTLGKLDISQSLNDIRSKIHEELDYEREATSQERFRELYAHDDRIVIPEVYREFSTRRVLTSELLVGETYYEFRDNHPQEEIDRTSEVLYEFVFGSFHRHGLFNADPHPGNYVFLGEGRVGFLDFGCVQEFPIEVPNGFGELVRAWWRGDEAFVREHLPKALGYPGDAPDDAKDFMFRYVTYLWRPIHKDEPFRYSDEYTREVYAQTASGAKIGARITWSEGYPDTEHRGLAMLNRLQFGFTSVLAGLRAEANWHRLLARFLDEQGSPLPTPDDVAEKPDDDVAEKPDDDVAEKP